MLVPTAWCSSTQRHRAFGNDNQQRRNEGILQDIQPMMSGRCAYHDTPELCVAVDFLLLLDNPVVLMSGRFIFRQGSIKSDLRMKGGILDWSTLRFILGYSNAERTVMQDGCRLIHPIPNRTCGYQVNALHLSDETDPTLTCHRDAYEVKNTLAQSQALVHSPQQRSRKVM